MKTPRLSPPRAINTYKGIADQGRIGWQRASGFNRRSLVENGFYRDKSIIGRCVRTRNLPNQVMEAKLGCAILNCMTGLAMPVSQKIA